MPFAQRICSGVLTSGANNAGLATILLLSGITSRAQVAAAAIQPDAVFDDLAHLLAETTAEVRPERR